MQASGAERVDRRRREAESLERPADEMGDALAFGRESIVLVRGHRYDHEALGGEVACPRIECSRLHPEAVDDDRLTGQAARGDAVRSEERMGEQRLVGGREMAIEHLARDAASPRGRR